MAKREEYRNLSQAEAARLAGAIWIFGSIDIEHSRKRPLYYYPRIMLTMPNPLPFDYRKDEHEKVWIEERNGKKYFILEIGRQKLVEKRMKEILPFIGGEEAEQIRLALKIIETKRSRELSREEKTQKLKTLHEEWKQSRERLRTWVEDFKAKHKDAPPRRVPIEIWNKAYLLEDC